MIFPLMNNPKAWSTFIELYIDHYRFISLFKTCSLFVLTGVQHRRRYQTTKLKAPSSGEDAIFQTRGHGV